MRHMIEFADAAFFFLEYSTREDDGIRPIQMPSTAFAYRLFILPTVPESTGEYQVVPKRLNVSKWYYPDASLLTAADIEAMNITGEYSILLSNMRSNGWDKVIRTKLGNFQPYTDDSVIL